MLQTLLCQYEEERTAFKVFLSLYLISLSLTHTLLFFLPLYPSCSPSLSFTEL